MLRREGPGHRAAEAPWSPERSQSARSLGTVSCRPCHRAVASRPGRAVRCACLGHPALVAQGRAALLHTREQHRPN